MLRVVFCYRVCEFLVVANIGTRSTRAVADGWVKMGVEESPSRPPVVYVMQGRATQNEYSYE